MPEKWERGYKEICVKLVELLGSWIMKKIYFQAINIYVSMWVFLYALKQTIDCWGHCLALPIRRAICPKGLLSQKISKINFFIVISFFTFSIGDDGVITCHLACQWSAELTAVRNCIGAPVIDHCSKEEQLYEDLLRILFIRYFIGV